MLFFYLLKNIGLHQLINRNITIILRTSKKQSEYLRHSRTLFSLLQCRGSTYGNFMVIFLVIFKGFFFSIPLFLRIKKDYICPKSRINTVIMVKMGEILTMFKGNGLVCNINVETSNVEYILLPCQWNNWKIYVLLLNICVHEICVHYVITCSCLLPFSTSAFLL